MIFDTLLHERRTDAHHFGGTEGGNAINPFEHSAFDTVTGLIYQAVAEIDTSRHAAQERRYHGYQCAFRRMPGYNVYLILTDISAYCTNGLAILADGYFTFNRGGYIRKAIVFC